MVGNMNNIKVSVVVPVFNEEAGIFEFLDKELSPVLKGLKYETEIVLVNDGSFLSPLLIR